MHIWDTSSTMAPPPHICATASTNPRYASSAANPNRPNEKRETRNGFLARPRQSNPKLLPRTDRGYRQIADVSACRHGRDRPSELFHEIQKSRRLGGLIKIAGRDEV